MTKTFPNDQRQPSRFRRGARIVERILAITGLYFIVYTTCFELSVISSPSMSPTLQGTSFETGDWVLSERVSLWFRQPRRWEVVQFRDEEGSSVMKRVAGLPGETVTLKEGEILINDGTVERPSTLKPLKYIPFGNLRNGARVSCEKGFYLLGDYSNDSQDSRFDGPIPTQKIKGRSWCRIWPPSRIGWVNP